MAYTPQNPLIVQSDRSLLLEVDNPRYEAARDELVRFAELGKSPEHIHTYRVTPLSLWNAAAAGTGADEIVQALDRYSKFDLPANVIADRWHRARQSESGHVVDVKHERCGAVRDRERRWHRDSDHRYRRR